MVRETEQGGFPRALFTGWCARRCARRQSASSSWRRSCAACASRSTARTNRT